MKHLVKLAKGARVESKIPTILKEILEKKATKKILQKAREVPLNVPNLDKNLIIAEIKRASPSAGKIGEIKEPYALAQSYLKGGADAISVLCEEDYFKGSLSDLESVKVKNPNAVVLRKDFITKIEQVKEAYEYGADMILLIAAVFVNGENGGFARLESLYKECLKLGLTPLVEVHNEEEIEFIVPLNASLVGINSRNLHNFKINKIKAYNLLDSIKAKSVIFESSLNSSFDAFIVGNLGFSGILCGSYLVKAKNPQFALSDLKEALKNGQTSQNTFYKNAFKLLESKLGLIKICGINCLESLEIAQNELLRLESNAKAVGADKIAALGFILDSASPRFLSDFEILKKVDSKFLKVAVVRDNKEQLMRGISLYKSGLIDALQLHGISSEIFGGVDLREANFPFYAVLNIENASDFKNEFLELSPFVLLDSKSPQGGGSGKSIDLKQLEKIKEKLGESPLCIAGGVGCENLAEFKKLGAKMLDFNSKLESTTALKDAKKTKTAIDEILKSS